MVALRRALGDGVAADGVHDPHALADALGRVGRIARQPGLVVVISDFREQHDWARALGALRARHSVLAVEVHDPREAEIPPVGPDRRRRPRDGRADGGRHVATARARALRRAGGRAPRDAGRRELRRLRVDHAPLCTGEDWLLHLGRRLR